MESKDETRELLDGRASTYGDTTDNAERVAAMWNAYLGINVITPADMMMMMALYKAVRFKVTPDYADNINDVLGYAQIVKDVQAKTSGLIEAETAKEYQAKKRMIDLTPEERITRNLAGDHEPITQDTDPLGHNDDDEDLKESRRPPEFRRTLKTAGKPDQSDGRVMDVWLRNRCGKPTEAGTCRYASLHCGECRA